MSYKSVLIAFLSWLDGEDYAQDTEVTQETLAGITGQEVVQWMTYRAYGMATLNDHDRPTHARSSSL